MWNKNGCCNTTASSILDSPTLFFFFFLKVSTVKTVRSWLTGQISMLKFTKVQIYNKTSALSIVSHQKCTSFVLKFWMKMAIKTKTTNIFTFIHKQSHMILILDRHGAIHVTHTWTYIMQDADYLGVRGIKKQETGGSPSLWPNENTLVVCPGPS